MIWIIIGIIYIITMIFIFKTLKGEEKFEKSDNAMAFWAVFLFFIPIINTVLLFIFTDWYKIANKIFRLK